MYNPEKELTKEQIEMLDMYKKMNITKKQVRAMKKEMARRISTQLRITEAYARREYVNKYLFWKELERIAQ